MVEFADGRRSAARRTRGAILASLLIVRVITYVSVQDFPAPEPHREIVDINAYPWSSIGKVAQQRRSSTLIFIKRT